MDDGQTTTTAIDHWALWADMAPDDVQPDTPIAKALVYLDGAHALTVADAATDLETVRARIGHLLTQPRAYRLRVDFRRRGRGSVATREREIVGIPQPSAPQPIAQTQTAPPSVDYLATTDRSSVRDELVRGLLEQNGKLMTELLHRADGFMQRTTELVSSTAQLQVTQTQETYRAMIHMMEQVSAAQRESHERIARAQTQTADAKMKHTLDMAELAVKQQNSAPQQGGGLLGALMPKIEEAIQAKVVGSIEGLLEGAVGGGDEKKEMITQFLELGASLLRPSPAPAPAPAPAPPPRVIRKHNATADE